MKDCCVLRCTQSGDEVLQLTRSPTNLLMETVVCTDHKLAIDDGERWVYQENLTPAVSSILMGDDLPPLLTDAQVSEGHFSDQAQSFLLRLGVERPDGGPDLLTFEVPQHLGADLAEWLRWVADPGDLGSEGDE